MSKRPAFTARLGLEYLEDRTTPTFLPGPSGGAINVNGVNVPTGGLSVAAGDLLPDAFTFFGRLMEEGVVALPLDRSTIRMVTHCDVSSAGVDRAIAAVRKAAAPA